MFDNEKYTPLINAFKCLVERFECNFFKDEMLVGKAILIGHRPHIIRGDNDSGAACIWGLAYENGEWSEMPLYMKSKSIQIIFDDAISTKKAIASKGPLSYYDEDLELITKWGMSQVERSQASTH